MTNLTDLLPPTDAATQVELANANLANLWNIVQSLPEETVAVQASQQITLVYDALTALYNQLADHRETMTAMTEAYQRVTDGLRQQRDQAIRELEHIHRIMDIHDLIYRLADEIESALEPAPLEEEN